MSTSYEAKLNNTAMSAEGLEPPITPLAAERSTIELRTQRGESISLSDSSLSKISRERKEYKFAWASIEHLKPLSIPMHSLTKNYYSFFDEYVNHKSLR